MAKPRNKKQQRARKSLQEKAYLMFAVGLVMLAAPMFLGNSPIGAALSHGMRTPGWLSLGVGLVLMAVHHMRKSESQQSRSNIPSLAEVLRELDEPTGPPIAPSFAATAPEPAFKQIREVYRQPARNTLSNWSPAVFAAIEWRRFEAVCEKLFSQSGFQTKSQSHGADGGVDIWLYSRHADGPAAVVQCKHWHNKAVGVRELREFFGVMASHKLARGTYATTSTYTADARQFAKVNGINTLDGSDLLSLITKRTPEQQQELLDVAYEGEYWRPTCASCGIKLVERTPSKGGAKFWGCSNYPRCKSRIAMAAQKV